MTDKVCIVTGATGALGFEVCKQLAELGACVIMGCRNTQKGKEACNTIIEQTGNENVEVMKLNLASLSSVQKFCNNFLSMNLPLHVLINNAAVINCPHSLTEDGFDCQSQINYIAPFLLTNLLLERMIQSAPARIINVSAMFHPWGKKDLSVLHGEHGNSGMKQFANSKLALVQFTYELANRLDGSGVTANIVDPVISHTWGYRSMKTGPVKLLFRATQKFVGQNPALSANYFVWLASSPEVENVTGKYFIKCKPMKLGVKKYNRDFSQTLWKNTKKALGISTPV